MKNLTLEHIAEACGGIYHGTEAMKKEEVASIFTAEKQKRVDFFVPIKGARVDAHDFIPQVMEQGVLATLSEKDLGEQEYPYIQGTSFPSGSKRDCGILFKTAADSW